MPVKCKILIVDDDIGLGETLYDILCDKGHQVVVVQNGWEAVTKSKETDFDVVLMDIKMPGLNGVETYREIKKMGSTPTVIVMTAYAVEDLLEQARQEGAYEVMFKPLDIDRLMELVDRSQSEMQAFMLDDHGLQEALDDAVASHS